MRERYYQKSLLVYLIERCCLKIKDGKSLTIFKNNRQLKFFQNKKQNCNQ